MKGNAIILKTRTASAPSGTAYKAVATSTMLTLDIQQQVTEIEPIPGTISGEAAKWKQFKRGSISWSVNNSGFFSTDSRTVLSHIGEDVETEIKIGDTTLNSSGVMESAEVNGNVGSLAKMSINIKGHNLP